MYYEKVFFNNIFHFEFEEDIRVKGNVSFARKIFVVLEFM
jgi:hypothetical protein